MLIKKKTAVVTGASTGIGQVVAIELAKVGYEVYLVARTKKRLEQTKKIIEKNKSHAVAFVADLSKVQSINRLITEIKNKINRVDVLANIAGIWHGKDGVYAGRDFATFSQKVIMDTFTVGTIAPILLAHAFVPLMRKGGRIINLSGTFETGASGWLSYYVSKRAIEDLTVGLAQELKDQGIKVFGISPSDTATEAYKKFFPQYIKDAIDPLEIGKFAVRLCKEEKFNNGSIFVLKKGKKPFEAFHF